MTSETDSRRILVTGVSRFLGLRLTMELASEPDVERVVGVDLDEPPIPIGGLEFVRADIRNPLIARVLETTKVDTIVHTNISSTPARLGGRSRMKEINVMGTITLLAAAQRARAVRRVVVRSSAAVYGTAPGDPSLLTEDHAARHADLAGYARDCAEAETYARDFGRRRKDVDLVVLRTQNVIGPTVDTSIARYFSLPVVPIALGYDPRLQLLHEEDAVSALRSSLNRGVRGIFNIAGSGVVYLSQAIRMLGRPAVPLALPAVVPAARIVRTIRMIDFPMDQLSLLLYGRVLDIRRAADELPFRPRWSTADCIADFKNNRNAEMGPAVASHPAWERQLLEYLNRASDSERV